jgi:hypothetical protein
MSIELEHRLNKWFVVMKQRAPDLKIYSCIRIRRLKNQNVKSNPHRGRRWPGQTPGGIGLALIFLFLFASRQKESNGYPALCIS